MESVGLIGRIAETDKHMMSELQQSKVVSDVVINPLNLCDKIRQQTDKICCNSNNDNRNSNVTTPLYHIPNINNKTLLTTSLCNMKIKSTGVGGGGIGGDTASTYWKDNELKNNIIDKVNTVNVINQFSVAKPISFITNEELHSKVLDLSNNFISNNNNNNNNCNNTINEKCKNIIHNNNIISVVEKVSTNQNSKTLENIIRTKLLRTTNDNDNVLLSTPTTTIVSSASVVGRQQCIRDDYYIDSIQNRNSLHNIPPTIINNIQNNNAVATTTCTTATTIPNTTSIMHTTSNLINNNNNNSTNKPSIDIIETNKNIIINKTIENNKCKVIAKKYETSNKKLNSIIDGIKARDNKQISDVCVKENNINVLQATNEITLNNTPVKTIIVPPIITPNIIALDEKQIIKNIKANGNLEIENCVKVEEVMSVEVKKDIKSDNNKTSKKIKKKKSDQVKIIMMMMYVVKEFLQ